MKIFLVQKIVLVNSKSYINFEITLLLSLRCVFTLCLVRRKCREIRKKTLNFYDFSCFGQ